MQQSAASDPFAHQTDGNSTTSFADVDATEARYLLAKRGSAREKGKGVLLTADSLRSVFINCVNASFGQMKFTSNDATDYLNESL
ncbi:hypothetical protein [Roseiconus lacunae]|uniref:hypothetical protein n=1 Tax=Roseiconus lacunae TaxID=2605694 RepID=UPI001E4BFE2E|nr:hypothetical protein [Roseiconus lacunae]MCD0460776.1 hypothetical protein [Roseiconus lacunae]